MKKIALAVTSIVSMMSYGASATSLDINVIGTISSASCVPTATGGGVVDYGFIKPDALAESGPTVLDVKTVAFTINCDAPTNVALRASSNRMATTTDAKEPESAVGSASASTELVTAGFGQKMPYAQPKVQQPTIAGLGTSNGKNIGGYMLNLPPSLVSLDGIDATNKYYTVGNRPTSSTSWKKEAASLVTGNGHTLFTTNGAYFAYGTNNESTVPTPFTQFAGTLLVQAFVTDKTNLDLSSPINLDGSSTIELYYF